MPASEAAENELFLTSIGRIKIPESEQTTNLLADNSFKYRITSTDKTITSIAPIPYTFSTSSNSRYDESEFKGLLIDSGAATRSTGGIGQLKALQKIDDSINFTSALPGQPVLYLELEAPHP